MGVVQISIYRIPEEHSATITIEVEIEKPARLPLGVNPRVRRCPEPRDILRGINDHTRDACAIPDSNRSTLISHLRPMHRETRPLVTQEGP